MANPLFQNVVAPAGFSLRGFYQPWLQGISAQTYPGDTRVPGVPPLNPNVPDPTQLYERFGQGQGGAYGGGQFGGAQGAAGRDPIGRPAPWGGYPTPPGGGGGRPGSPQGGA